MVPAALRIGPYTASLPVVQGGMGVGISLSGLASAVANEGGIGVIATAGIGMNEPDIYKDFLEANKRALRREIQRAREKTKGLIGVNILVPLSNYADMARMAIEEKVEIIFSGAALPLNLPSFLDGTTHTKLVPSFPPPARRGSSSENGWTSTTIVQTPSSWRGPRREATWASRRENFPIRPSRSKPCWNPCCARPKPRRPRTVHSCHRRGGIYTGEDMYRVMALGASGVQIATRFVTTHECDAAPGFKQAYIDATPEDIVIIKSPIGLPGRAIRNRFIQGVEAGERAPVKCPTIAS